MQSQLSASQPTLAAQQLELEVHRPAQADRSASSGSPVKARKRVLPRLTVSPDEAAEMLGVSRDYLDEHVLRELRSVRRGRRVLIALSELERWVDQSATRAAADRRA